MRHIDGQPYGLPEGVDRVVERVELILDARRLLKVVGVHRRLHLVLHL